MIYATDSSVGKRIPLAVALALVCAAASTTKARQVECGTVSSLPRDRVVIIDPVNAANNVARRITDLECDEIITKATDAWETITAARNNNYKG